MQYLFQKQSAQKLITITAEHSGTNQHMNERWQNEISQGTSFTWSPRQQEWNST